ncbi:MAG: signal protein PDZ [Promicromonosporaceae bacterium]|nr:signal protein PDZ [Promicromonosporaceae bacterium]
MSSEPVLPAENVPPRRADVDELGVDTVPPPRAGEVGSRSEVGGGARRNVRAKILAVTAPLTAALAAIAVLLPTGYAVRAPGPTQDTLGSQVVAGQELQMVEISGAPVHATTGQLLLTTVSVSGGPIGAVMPMDVLYAWLAPSRSVVPAEAVFRPGITREEQQEQSQMQMMTSQEAATAAALFELGFEIPMKMTVMGFSADSGAEGYLEVGDELQAVDGVTWDTFGELLEVLSVITPGSVVTVTVDRGGDVLEIPITTGVAANDDGSERAALGIFLRSNFDFPIDVDIQIANIGGPSAGTMFALAIIDQLTELDELQGISVAGTGAINPDGDVLAIGGVRQKMYGARRDGAQWFLTPVTNCGEVVGAVPRGLTVVPVATLAEARSAITAIGAGEGGGLPSCG